MPSSTTTPAAQTWCLDPGPLRPLVAQFTNHLASLGHTTLTVGGYGDAARHFTVWLRQSSIAIARVDDNTCAEFAAHRCRCPGIRRCDRVSAKYARRARRFVCFLAECGVVDKLALPGPAPVEPRVALFQDWLRQHRGISESTISRYGRMVVRLQIALGADPAHYTAASIRRAILDELRGTSAAHVKTMTTALRGYLRFLGASGACDLELMRAVPTIPQWRLSAMPRYLPAEDVDRVIASCDAGKARGIRDRAILLLLSRLGLRAGDVLDLRLSDICWTDGTLRVRGKGRREVCLPLPQDAGDALLKYICQARPMTTATLCSCAHLRPTEPLRDPRPFHPWSDWRWPGPRSRTRHRTVPTCFAILRRPPCCAPGPRWTPSAPSCGIAQRPPRPTTPRSTFLCCFKSPSPGRERHHAEP